MTDKVKDIKDRMLPITLGTFAVILIFMINVAFYIGSKQTNIERDILENRRAIEALVKHNQVQDIKIETNQASMSDYSRIIGIINEKLNTISDDVKEIKSKR